MMTARKLLIGDYDTARDGKFTLCAVSCPLPAPQQSRVSVPGMDGTMDYSTVLTAGEPWYGDRTFSATLETSEGSRDERDERISAFVALVHGHVWPIVHPDAPDHALQGRVSIDVKYNDLAHAQVVITAICGPWLVKLTPTVVSEELTGEDKEISLPNERRRVVPTIEVSADTTVTWEGQTIAMSAGSHRDLDIRLAPGDNTLLARTTAGGEGAITITYQEARL